MTEQFAEKMLDHAQSPRNMGVIDEPHGAGRIESDCGDWVLMTLSLDDAGAISDVRFVAQGLRQCGGLGLGADRAGPGQDAGQAAAITAEDVVTHIGGLPEHKTHCSQMSHAAFIAAVESAGNGTLAAEADSM